MVKISRHIYIVSHQYAIRVLEKRKFKKKIRKEISIVKSEHKSRCIGFYFMSNNSIISKRQFLHIIYYDGKKENMNEALKFRVDLLNLIQIYKLSWKDTWNGSNKN